jgi:hypothetical protein
MPFYQSTWQAQLLSHTPICPSKQYDAPASFYIGKCYLPCHDLSSESKVYLEQLLADWAKQHVTNFPQVR